MQQTITFNATSSVLNFDARFEPDEWMEKLTERRVSANGLTITYTTDGPISEQLQSSICSFSGVKSAMFNQ